MSGSFINFRTIPNIAVTDTTPATSTTTGCATFAGGIGVGGGISGTTVSLTSRLTCNDVVAGEYIVNSGIRSANTSGINLTSPDLSIRTGNGTGNAPSANILFLTSTPTSSGSTSHTTTERMRLSGLGNLLIGTITDNAVDRIQVSGSGLFTGQLKVTDSTSSTSTTTGCATFAGGIGVIGDIRSGGLVTASSATLGVLRASDASGTNTAGTSLVIRPGFSTGNAASPNIQFQTGNVGSSGSTVQSGSEKMRLSGLGNLLIGTTTDNAADRLQVNGGVLATQFKLSALNTAPASATATGTLGEIRVTATHIFICTATNTWVRAALSTW